LAGVQPPFPTTEPSPARACVAEAPRNPRPPWYPRPKTTLGHDSRPRNVGTLAGTCGRAPHGRRAGVSAWKFLPAPTAPGCSRRHLPSSGKPFAAADAGSPSGFLAIHRSSNRHLSRRTFGTESWSPSSVSSMASTHGGAQRAAGPSRCSRS
jgi:hypothetical protein